VDASGDKNQSPPEDQAGQTNKESYRDYRGSVRPGVAEFYRANHRHQTVDFVRAKSQQFAPGKHGRMTVWEAMEFLDTLVDDSDPDTQVSQMQHLLQTAEAIRRAGHPPWFVLTGLIHDLGKTLCLFGEPQWAAVGDTFPVGCRFSDKIVFAEFFAENPDSQRADLMTETGMYQPGCGLDNVLISWGHDEYMYRVARDFLPPEALAMIRYHSLYACHREGAYRALMTEQDHEMMKWVRAFNAHDLYSKGTAPVPVARVKPYYLDLIAQFFPAKLEF
jgi:inositol oxygenase